MSPHVLARVLGLGPFGEVDVIVAAPSKAAASRALAVLGLDIPARQIEPAMGNNVDALRTAGLLDAPAAYVMPSNRWHNVSVVAYDSTGSVLVAIINEKPVPIGSYSAVAVPRLSLTGPPDHRPVPGCPQDQPGHQQHA